MLDKTSTFVCVVFGATLAMLPIAHADTDPDASSATPAASADGTDRLTLPRGRLLLDAFLEVNLSDGAAFKPVSITPDLWYGETDELTVGIVHSSLGATGFIGAAGDALCLTGKNNGCPDFYPGLGIDVRYGMKKPIAGFAWALDGGLFVGNFNPFALSIKLGAAGRWHQGKLAIELAPNLFFGLTNRTIDVAAAGGGTVSVNNNRDFLNIPVTAIYTVAPKVAVSAQTGLSLPFEDSGDLYEIPLSIAGHYVLDYSTTLSVVLSLPALIGGSALQNGFDARTLTLGGTYAF